MIVPAGSQELILKRGERDLELGLRILSNDFKMQRVMSASHLLDAFEKNPNRILFQII